MSKIALEGQLSETTSTVTVSASPDAGGQLVTDVTNAYDVTICVPVAPVRLKWRIGTSGDWRETEGGECFTVSGADAQSLYLAKQSEQSASVVATSTVRQLTSVSAAGLTVPIVTYSQTAAGRIRLSDEELDEIVGTKRWYASASSGTPVTYAGDGTPKVFARHTIQAKTLPPGTKLRMHAVWQKYGVAGAIEIRAKLDGELIFNAWAPPAALVFEHSSDLYVGFDHASVIVSTTNNNQIELDGALRYVTAEGPVYVPVDFSDDVVFELWAIASTGENLSLLAFALEASL